MLALLLTFLACSCQDRAPDVILVTVDTLRSDGPSYAGNDRPTSPNLDALTAEATWFSRAYSTSSWTLPATTSILTGLHPWEHRVIHDYKDRSAFGRLDAAIPTLGTTLKAQGYRTAAFINNAFLAPEFGLNQGFDNYDFHGAPMIGHRTAYDTVDAALSWLDASQEPALAWVHIMEPHADYDPGERFAGTFTEGLPHELEFPLGALVDQMIQGHLVPKADDQAYILAGYDEEILASDAAIGQLIEGLKARGRWEDTRFVFTSDHGEEFWEYGAYEHGHSTRSVVTQVPLIVKAPGVKPGRNDSVVDIAMTFDLMNDGSGELLRLARAGTETGRHAIMEDTLYSEQELSVVTDDLRFVYNMERTIASLHEIEWVDGVTMEGPDLMPDPAQRPRGKPLYDMAKDARGNLDLTEISDTVAIPSPETFNQLRALGYVE